MKRMRIFGFSLLAAAALFVAAASSSLGAVELGRCVSQPGNGFYTTSNCSKKISTKTSNFEWLKGTAGAKNKFTSKSASAFLEGENGSVIKCEKSTASGKDDEDGTTHATKGVESVFSLFEECKAVSLAEACHNKGTNEIGTEELEGNYGDLQEVPEIAGEELKPGVKAKIGVSGHKLFAKFECAGFIVETTEGAAAEGGTSGGGNCLIGEQKKANEMAVVSETEWATAAKGKQKWQFFTNKKPPLCQLESVLRAPGGKPEHATQNELAETTGEEALEIKD